MPFETSNPAQELRDKARDMFPFNTKLAESTYHWNAANEIDRLTAKIEADAKVIAALREAQWPEEATEEMKQAIYALDLGKNRLSEDDVIDIYDTFRKVALGVNEQTVGNEK
jgi:hypothetical protein